MKIIPSSSSTTPPKFNTTNVEVESGFHQEYSTPTSPMMISDRVTKIVEDIKMVEGSCAFLHV
jgi:hypothetical protein